MAEASQQDTAKDAPEKPLTRSEEKRAQIVQAASLLFTEHGYGAVSMDGIAAEAKVSKRTVYSHFDDKAALFAAIMEGHCSQLGGNLILVSNEDGNIIVPPEVATRLPDLSPRTVLTHYIARFLKIVLSPNGVKVFRIVQAEAERFPDLARMFTENATDPMMRRLSGYLAQISAEAGSPIPDPELASWRLVALSKEPFHIHQSLGLWKEPDEDTIFAHAQDSVDFFLSAYKL